LKRELPRIPYAPDFRAFATAGEKLAKLHLDYEKLELWKLRSLETLGDPNREDDEQYIVRLVGQVTRVSVETVGIVKGLPEKFA